MFSPCVFVCLFVTLFVSLSRCLSGRFNYEGLVPHKQYFAGTLLGMSSCASYVSGTHDVIDVTRSQSKSNFESVDQKLKMSEMLMAIFLVHSTSGITSGKNQFVGLKMAAIFENSEILNTASIWPQIWKDRPKLCQKKFFMVMTSSMTSQGGLKVSLYIHV